MSEYRKRVEQALSNWKDRQKPASEIPAFSEWLEDTLRPALVELTEEFAGCEIKIKLHSEDRLEVLISTTGVRHIFEANEEWGFVYDDGVPVPKAKIGASKDEIKDAITSDIEQRLSH